MTPERWNRASELLLAALDQPVGGRAAWLAEACGDDLALRNEVQSLLDAHAGAADALDGPAAAVAGGLLDSTAPTLEAGARLGPYEVLALLGEGGMGRVYRARDARLERDVALKVLSGSGWADPEARRRFEREARAAAALSHPNVLAVYDVGEQEGRPYIVTELLEGAALRQQLSGGPLPVKRALGLAVPVAQGLAAAHERGIVHRDLKPENVFVTSDGRVKILDFGLARWSARPSALTEDTASAAGAPTTTPGVVMGTVGYMAPEQVRGEKADHRADVFAFGVMLFEMLSGERPFKGRAPLETLSAILRDDPPPVGPPGSPLPEPLARVVLRCLEKDPAQRFQSARDLAFALEALSLPTSTSQRTGTVTARRPRRVAWLAGALLLAAGIAGAAFVAGLKTATRPAPTFERLTFRHGTLATARFAPDGQTIVYSAGWEGSPFQVFTTRMDSSESRSLGLPDAQLVSVSSAGELALLLGARRAWSYAATLARVPLAGGAPREVLDRVLWADWSPDGKELAVVRGEAEQSILEYPIGTRLLQTPSALMWLRVSPNGELVAFAERAGERLSVAVADRRGHKTVLSDGWIGSITGLAWSPSGDEIWFCPSDGRSANSLHAVDRSGRLRLVLRAPIGLHIQDIRPDGRVLLARHLRRAAVMHFAPGSTRERDLSWGDWSELADITADGGTILFGEHLEAGGATGAVYLRRADGSPAVRLGDGEALALSPDGRQALALQRGKTPEFVLWPTGPGAPRRLPTGGLVVWDARFFPDGERLLVLGEQEGHGRRLYVQSLTGGAPQPFTPEGITSVALPSPDGRAAVARGPDRKMVLFPLDGGPARPLAGLEAGERPAAWSTDGRWLYVHRATDVPSRVFRVDVASGRRELWKTLAPAEPGGAYSLAPVRITPDASAYAYTVHKHVSDLYLVAGLR